MNSDNYSLIIVIFFISRRIKNEEEETWPKKKRWPAQLLRKLSMRMMHEIRCFKESLWPYIPDPVSPELQQPFFSLRREDLRRVFWPWPLHSDILVWQGFDWHLFSIGNEVTCVHQFYLLKNFTRMLVHWIMTSQLII